MSSASGHGSFSASTFSAASVGSPTFAYVSFSYVELSIFKYFNVKKVDLLRGR